MKRINTGIQYGLAVIGKGIGGTSIINVFANYTNVENIIIFDKEKGTAKGNSHPSQNSQTLHTGDIETNYSYGRSVIVEAETSVTAKHLELFAPEAYRLDQKMVIGVGEEEVKLLTERFASIKHLYPKLRLIGREEIEILEPNVIKGRDPKIPICALQTIGYTVNFQKLAMSLLAQAKKTGKNIKVCTGVFVEKIYKIEGGYKIVTAQGSYTAKKLIVMAAGRSLLFAKQLGYGNHLGLLPVAGNFYFAKELYLLNGKVYTVQNPKLPFAAVHGDVEIGDESITRFGPTAKVLPVLERRKGLNSFFAFLKTSVWTVKGVLSLFKVISDKTLFLYVIKNMLYDIPYLGKYLFLLQARKVVPSLKYNSIYKAKKTGGMRHQLLDTRTGKMEMEKTEIIDRDVIFNISHSPGASVDFKKAYDYAKLITEASNGEFTFDQEAWDAIYAKKEIKKEELVS